MASKKSSTVSVIESESTNTNEKKGKITMTNNLVSREEAITKIAEEAIETAKAAAINEENAAPAAPALVVPPTAAEIREFNTNFPWSQDLDLPFVTGSPRDLFQTDLIIFEGGDAGALTVTNKYANAKVRQSIRDPRAAGRTMNALRGLLADDRTVVGQGFFTNYPDVLFATKREIRSLVIKTPILWVAGYNLLDLYAFEHSARRISRSVNWGDEGKMLFEKYGVMNSKFYAFGLNSVGNLDFLKVTDAFYRGAETEKVSLFPESFKEMFSLVEGSFAGPINVTLHNESFLGLGNAIWNQDWETIQAERFGRMEEAAKFNRSIEVARSMEDVAHLSETVKAAVSKPKDVFVTAWIAAEAGANPEFKPFTVEDVKAMKNVSGALLYVRNGNTFQPKTFNATNDMVAFFRGLSRFCGANGQFYAVLK